MDDLIDIQQKILSFRNRRDWEQFHDPKNLAEAISIRRGLLQPLEDREQSCNLLQRAKKRQRRIS
jgi:hypothetical protein